MSVDNYRWLHFFFVFFFFILCPAGLITSMSTSQHVNIVNLFVFSCEPSRCSFYCRFHFLMFVFPNPTPSFLQLHFPISHHITVIATPCKLQVVKENKKNLSHVHIFRLLGLLTVPNSYFPQYTVQFLRKFVFVEPMKK